ncbi:MAG TPA: HPr kinase/phosphatase C-terminal domain-containing protein [Allosphingosinicella sp.]|jgi:serine kinase of HPr protein (carbohydrate metabolism regulator)
MSAAALSSETVHASCVAVGDRAVLIGGRSGSGKSDLALRLIDRGARLVSDDYTLVRRVEGRLLAEAPANIAGKIEVRGLGILEFEPVRDVPVALFVDLDEVPQRVPQENLGRTVAGLEVPVVGLAALEASAPLKVEAAIHVLGLRL